MKTNKLTKHKRKNKITINGIGALIVENKVFVAVVIVIIFIFVQLVQLNSPIQSLNRRGLRFLNKYENPTNLIESGRCMRPYDVGDGVITFGPGITYPTETEGLVAINTKLGTDYSAEDDCIKISDLKDMQKVVIKEYEEIVVNIEKYYDLVFTQDQFNALVLLAYNSPNLFLNQNFIAVITNPESSYEQYVAAADSYYQQLDGYYTGFGTGWYNRIKDSAEMYYFGDYRFQNNLEE